MGFDLFFLSSFLSCKKTPLGENDGCILNVKWWVCVLIVVIIGTARANWCAFFALILRVT